MMTFEEEMLIHSSSTRDVIYLTSLHRQKHELQKVA